MSIWGKIVAFRGIFSAFLTLFSVQKPQKGTTRLPAPSTYDLFGSGQLGAPARHHSCRGDLSLLVPVKASMSFKTIRGPSQASLM